jgi:hypothetical protein
MGYFKELMMDNEEGFFDYVSQYGVVVNGKQYRNAELLQNEQPVAYFDLIGDYINGLVYED